MKKYKFRDFEFECLGGRLSVSLAKPITIKKILEVKKIFDREKKNMNDVYTALDNIVARNPHRTIDGKDVFATFNTQSGQLVLKYLMKSYYHITSNKEELEITEGARRVVIDLIDKIKADCGSSELNKLIASINLF